MSRFARIVWKLIVRAGWAPILVFAVHVFISRAFNIYNPYPGIDIPMHLLGGFVISYFLFSCFAALPADAISPQLRSLAQIFFVVGMTATAAVVWEFGEYAVDTVLRTHQLGDVYDTLLDMAMGLCGAAAFLLVALWRGKVGNVRPLEHG